MFCVYYRLISKNTNYVRNIIDKHNRTVMYPNARRGDHTISAMQKIPRGDAIVHIIAIYIKGTYLHVLFCIFKEFLKYIYFKNGFSNQFKALQYFHS